MKKTIIYSATIIIMVFLAVVIFLWPNPLNSHRIISDQEFRSIAANWNLLGQTELYEIMQRDAQVKGLWEQGCLYLEEPYLNLSIVLHDSVMVTHDDSVVVRKQTFDGRTLQIESDSAMMLFRTDRFFDAQVFRSRVDQMLTIINEGIDSQWSVIFSSLASKTAINGTTQIIIKQPMLPQDEYRLMISEEQHSCTAAENTSVLPSVPTKEFIGKTREEILNEYGSAFIDIAWEHNYPIYPTKDGYIVIFVIDDTTTQVNRILVFDLLDLNYMDRTII